MIRKQMLMVLALSFVASSAAAFSYARWQGGPWNRVDEVDGIVVYRNSEVRGGIDAYRADAVVNATPDEVLALVLDHDRAKARSFVKRYDVLHDDGKTTRVYQQIRRPGLGTREVTAAGKIFRGEKAGSPSGFTFAMTSDGKDDPEVDSFDAMEGSFVLTPLDDGTRTRISYRMLIDPGTWIPTFVLRGALKDSTVEVVARLRSDAQAQ